MASSVRPSPQQTHRGRLWAWWHLRLAACPHAAWWRAREEGLRWAGARARGGTQGRVRLLAGCGLGCLPDAGSEGIASCAGGPARLSWQGCPIRVWGTGGPGLTRGLRCAGPPGGGAAQLGQGALDLPAPAACRPALAQRYEQLRAARQLHRSRGRGRPASSVRPPSRRRPLAAPWCC